MPNPASKPSRPTPQPSTSTLKPPKPGLNTQVVENYILNVVATQSIIGRITLMENTQQQFPQAGSDSIDTAIVALCQQNRMQLVNPDVDPSAQLICHIPA